MRVVTLGESLGLVRGAGIGSFAHLGSADIDTGGAEGNVAIGLVRLGVDVTWIGRVGDDSFGRRVVRDLRGEGVVVSAITDTSAATGLMLKETPHSGSTVITYFRSGSAGSLLCPADLDNVDLEGADLLHVSGVTLAISDSARAAAWAAVRRARSAGVRVSFDVNHRSRLWSAQQAAPAYRALACEAGIVFASDDEAALMLGARPDTETLDLAAGIARLGPHEIVVKHGAAGASAFAAGELITLPAVDVQVIDTVGAGDAFVAGYLSELLAGQPVAQRLRTATITGALACRHPGDWQGAGDQQDLRERGHDPVTR